MPMVDKIGVQPRFALSKFSLWTGQRCPTSVNVDHGENIGLYASRKGIHSPDEG